jgi:protein-tyrosine phosphatase
MENANFTEIPFNLPGRVYRSAMPFGGYDPGGALIPLYQQNQVNTVVALTEDSEILQKTGLDLLSIYSDKGFQVIHFPIQDFGTPDPLELNALANRVLRAARAGDNLAIHCSAGIGRTGMLLAVMARIQFGYSGGEAIQWVRRFVPYAVEGLQVGFITGMEVKAE